MKVPFYDGSQSFKKIWPEIEKGIDVIFDHGKFSHGRMVETVEAAIAAYVGAKHAIAVNSATDGLILILRALGIGPGDEVIVPAYTFFASASSVALVGATPVFVDIDPNTFLIDVNAVRNAVTPRTKAIMPVHLFIQMANIDELRQIAEERSIFLVEDSAEAIGMFYKGKHAGLHGIAGVLSFFPTKTLAAIGDAGMIITNDDALAEELKCTRHHGRTGKTLAHLPGISNEAYFCGTNSKMDDIHAAVIQARLGCLAEAISAREHIAALYTSRLSALQEIATPSFVHESAITNPVYYVYVVRAKNRDSLVDHLLQAGIGTEVYYPIPLHLQPCFASLGYSLGDMPNSEEASQEAVALPLYPDLSDSAANYVCDVIADFYYKR